jgi:hypothetical protein
LPEEFKQTKLAVDYVYGSWQRHKSLRDGSAAENDAVQGSFVDLVWDDINLIMIVIDDIKELRESLTTLLADTDQVYSYLAANPGVASVASDMVHNCRRLRGSRRRPAVRACARSMSSNPPTEQ